MPRKNNNRRRRLWINIKVRAKEIDQETVRQTLVDAVQRGDYVYPATWYVQLEWRNRENDIMKIGEFRAEMNKSRQSSTGFDEAVLKYLRET